MNLRWLAVVAVLISGSSCWPPFEPLFFPPDSGTTTVQTVDAGLPPATSCPSTFSFQDQACTGDFTCNYGTESCCGQTFTSIICRCDRGRMSCYYTDACYFRNCPDAGTP